VEPDDRDARLSRISTQWTMIFRAHRGGAPEEVAAAQAALMLRYAGAVHRYLLGALRDPDAAEELDQEFALRFLRGDFHRADPSKGRFRDFVKRAVRNLVVDHHRKRARSGVALQDAGIDPADPATDEQDRRFVESWRKELLSHAWDALEAYQDQTKRPYFLVLKHRVDHPEQRSHEVAAALSPRLGKPVAAGWVRQTLHRARDQFVGFLLEEVATSLDQPSPDDLQQELADLRLLEYCRPVLERDGERRG